MSLLLTCLSKKIKKTAASPSTGKVGKVIQPDFFGFSFLRYLFLRFPFIRDLILHFPFIRFFVSSLFVYSLLCFYILSALPAGLFSHISRSKSSMVSLLRMSFTLPSRQIITSAGLGLEL